MQPNLTEIQVKFDSGGLDICPIWWQNYVNLMHPLIDKLLMHKLYKDWKIKETHYDDEYMELTFPSEEVYVQFLLTYG